MSKVKPQNKATQNNRRATPTKRMREGLFYKESGDAQGNPCPKRVSGASVNSLGHRTVKVV